MRQMQERIRDLEATINGLQDDSPYELQKLEELEDLKKMHQHLEASLDSRAHHDSLEQGTRDSHSRQANLERIRELERQNRQIRVRHDTHLDLRALFIREQEAHERRRNDILRQMIVNGPELWRHLDPPEEFH